MTGIPVGLKMLYKINELNLFLFTRTLLIHSSMEFGRACERSPEKDCE